jgi:hypothetical protein
VGVSTPVQIEKELAEIAAEIDLWDARLAWHEAARDFYKTRFTIAEAKAAMEYSGAVGKAKWWAATKTEKERTDLDIAGANFLVCERKIHSLEKQLFTLMARNKLIMQAYNSSGGNW